MLAFCLLPNHLHCIWQMPPEDSDYSKRWSMIKRTFSKCFVAAGGSALAQSDSHRNKRELGVWQRRFWEHRIRDEDDYWNHVHYIHYNPIKHSLVERVEDWPHSTFHRFRQDGVYDDFDWSLLETNDAGDQMEFLE